MQNVAPHFRIFFNKYSPTFVNQFQVPYEYSSVMHYGVTVRTCSPTVVIAVRRINP